MKAGLSLREELLTRLGVRLNLGEARFYDGTQPTDSDTALSGNTLIANCQVLSYAVASGVIQITLGSATVTTGGTPTFARFVQFASSDGEFDMTVGVDLVLSKAAWTISETFPGMTVNIQLPVGT